MQAADNKDVFLQTKTGYRDVQFMEWLEYRYGCNLVTQVGAENFTGDKINNFHYCMGGQKELFYILDKCHVDVRSGAILDIGCGKEEQSFLSWITALIKLAELSMKKSF